MAMDEERRYEIKAAFHRLRLPALQEAVRTHPEGFTRAYPTRQVNNLYLDTPDLQCFNDNGAGLGQRFKVRIRWYGELATRVTGALEIKRRSYTTMAKLRHGPAIELDLSGASSWTRILHGVRERLPTELLAAIGSAWLPVIINRYRREYFVTGDGQIRITLDYDQVYYSQLSSFRPNLTWALPRSDASVVEIKAPVQAHERVLAAVALLPVRVTNNSKYAQAAYRALRA